MDIIIVPALLSAKSIIFFASSIVLADVILSWVIALEIFNTRNKFVIYLMDFVGKISGFLLAPIRRRLSLNIGRLDISPMIFFLVLAFFDQMIARILMRFV